MQPQLNGLESCRMSSATTTTPLFEVGAAGVWLKHFERVVRNLLSESESNDEEEEISIFYSSLPPPPASEEDWPFHVLPPQARVWGTNKGQISDPVRAKRKEDQLRSMIRCIQTLLQETTTTTMNQSSTTKSPTLVDFGGGTGHLAIPLALLFPHCHVVCVDLSEKSLHLLHQKADQISLAGNNQDDPNGRASNLDAFQLNLETKDHNMGSRLKRTRSIPNLYTFHGPVEAFDETTLSIDVGIALHLCGEATDVALRKCGQAQAKAIVFCPCCVGKISSARKNPYVFQATGSNAPTVSYPQSTQFSKRMASDVSIVSTQEDWNALAKAADYGEMPNVRTGQGAARRTAKSLLETDRCLFLQETFGYQTLLCRVDPWEATPKNDILLAWKAPINGGSTPLWIQQDTSCQVDLRTTSVHLFGADHCNMNETSESGDNKDALDWTVQEEAEMRQRIVRFLEDNSAKSSIDTDDKSNDDGAVLTFPTGMGSRKRKLVHYLAEQLNLAHWSVNEGPGKTGRTVAVARHRQ